MTDDKIFVWHHQLNGHEFEQTPGDSEGQGSLACCSPWGRKESDMTERLNNKSEISFGKQKWAMIGSERAGGTTSGWVIRKTSGKIRPEVGSGGQRVSRAESRGRAFQAKGIACGEGRRLVPASFSNLQDFSTSALVSLG